MRPVQHFENKLQKSRVPCYLPSSDDAELRKDLIADKVVFSSFHQSKGLERKLVVIFDFSGTYFKYYAKNLEPFR